MVDLEHWRRRRSLGQGANLRRLGAFSASTGDAEGHRIGSARRGPRETGRRGTGLWRDGVERVGSGGRAVCAGSARPMAAKWTGRAGAAQPSSQHRKSDSKGQRQRAEYIDASVNEINTKLM